MIHISYSKLNRIKIVFFLSFFLFYYAFGAVSGNVGAIIISGYDDSGMNNDVDTMAYTLKEAFSIPSSNVYTGYNQTRSQLQSAISSMNAKGVTDLHVYITSHGNKIGVEFTKGIIVAGEYLAYIINESTAPTKHIVLDSCNSGAHYEALNNIKGDNGSIVTSTDANSAALMSPFGGGGYFINAYARGLLNSTNDTDQNGVVSHPEALQAVKDEGGAFPNWGNPKNLSIPTLSEWKKMFLTLLMLSLVMGFIPNQLQTTAISNGITISRITCINGLAFNRHLYHFILKWIGIVVVLGLTGATIIFGHVSALDITGTLFCAPLVAYILHLVVLCKNDSNKKTRIKQQ